MSTTKVTDSMRDVTVVDAAKITTGTIPEARITTLDATKLTGTIHVDRISEASVTQHVTATDLSVLEYNQAILAFKIASANQLAKFSMVDQVIDEYQDATGIDAGASTNELAGGATTAKYFEGGSSVTATGGTITSYGAYTIHTFLTGADYVNNKLQAVEYLVVGGGGEGGDTYSGGGGGAGEFRTATGFSLPAATYTISVGAGGTGRTNDGDIGDSSSLVGTGITDVISIGGGGGAGYNGGSGSSNSVQMRGGSGGGGCGAGSGVQLGGATTGNGNAGGSGNIGAVRVSGGGGGAGAVGQDYQITSDPGTCGSGGAGLSSTIRDGSTAVFYAGGGGGGLNGAGGTAGVGGSGVGGTGGSASPTSGAAAAANTGSGGGGGGNSASTNGGAGGSGIVIIKRPTEASGGDLTLQSVATTAESAPTTADLVMLIEDGAGTATINTDIKAKVSRDGSAFSGYVTLVDEGDWGTNKRIFVARNIDISGITSGTAMKYKIETFNQSTGSKETRIHATSLAWA